MLANTITLIRLPLTFAVIAVFGRHRELDTALLAIIALIFVLDAVDGIVARRRDETSETGALLDTIADRIIENTFWIYFTATERLPLWIPITVMARGVFTDTLHHRHGAPKSRWAGVIVRSRMSRALYGTLKMLTFLCLASRDVFDDFRLLAALSLSLASVTVAFCLIRGLPICIAALRVPEKERNRC